MKNECPICHREYIHEKRLINHMAETNCGKLAGQLGITLDFDKRRLRGKNLEKEEVNTESIEEVEPQTTIKVDVERNQQESDIEVSNGDGVQPKRKSVRKTGRTIEETITCPNCLSEISFSRTVEQTEGVIDCPTCKRVWEWED